MADSTITSLGVKTSDLLGPFTLYLEGIRIKYASISISGTEGSYTSAQVLVPFDRKKLIRKIRPKTLGQIFFGNRLFLLFEGELVQKSYSKLPTGPGPVTLTFTGIAGNLASMKYAMLSPEQGGSGNVNVGSPQFATAAITYVISGLSIGTQIETNAGVNVGSGEVAYRGASIQRDLIGTRFEKALREEGKVDMAAAFREIINAFIYGAKTPGDKTGIEVVGAVAASSLAISDSRFGLVKSLVGVTNQDLISAFYGKTVEGKINPFIGTILGMGTVGEMNLMLVLKTLAYRSFHTITEMVAPPMTKDSAGTLALGRLMMIPRLFSADPPLCNVFFPQVVSAVDSNVSALKTTRLIVMQNNPATLAIPTAAIGISPQGLAEKMITKSGSTTKLSFSNAITQEEGEVGVLASVTPDVYGAAILFSKSPELLADWFALTGPLRFASQRSEQQTTVLNMEFNPFVALGFPGLVYDPDLGVIRGMVVSVKHNITASGAMTQVGMAYCIHGDDALEYQGYPDTDFDSGFAGASTKTLDTYKAGNPSDVYEKILGCRSLFKARADIAKEAASAASAKRVAALNQTTNSQENSDKNDEIAKEESDKAHAAALKADGVSEQARKLYEAITTKSGSMEAEKDAVRQLAIRNIASYEDLQRFYHTFGSIPSFKGFTQVTEPPFQLILKLPYASVQQKIKLTDKSGSGSTEMDFVVAADATPKPMQVIDRVGPVLDYATAIEE